MSKFSIDISEIFDRETANRLKRGGYNTIEDLYDVSVAYIHKVPWVGRKDSLVILHRIAQVVAEDLGIDTVYNSKIIFVSDKIQKSISEEITARMIVDKVVENE